MGKHTIYHLEEHVEVVVAGDTVVRSQQIDLEILHLIARERRKYIGTDRAEDLLGRTITLTSEERQNTVHVATGKASRILD